MNGENQAYPLELQRIIQWLGKLPGVGRRTAERLGVALMDWKPEEVRSFGAELQGLRDRIGYCSQCGNYATAGQLCSICRDEKRAGETLCVVERVPQIAVIEKTGCFHGRYHVLGGTLSPMNGVGPQDLRIAPLHERLKQEGIRELLLALSADVEGEATAQFLTQEFAGAGVTITRIATGIPVGTDLAYSDVATLTAAISSRLTYSSPVDASKK